MKPEELRELANDIAANGLRDPVTLTPDGLLLDGRNRALACETVGLEPRRPASTATRGCFRTAATSIGGA
jgi:ParB-like chromosome segregation protein Spo0J